MYKLLLVLASFPGTQSGSEASHELSLHEDYFVGDIRNKFIELVLCEASVLPLPLQV